MAALMQARLLVQFVPFGRWQARLGAEGSDSAQVSANADLDEAKRLAAQVEHAARRLPLATKCLPRAVALSSSLRSRGIAHAVVFVVRPNEQRQTSDSLHAWVEVGGIRVLGDLPGPWLETLRLGE